MIFAKGKSGSGGARTLALLAAAAGIALATGSPAWTQSRPTAPKVDITGVWIGARSDPNAPYKNTPMDRAHAPFTAEGERMSKFWDRPENNLGARCLPAGGPGGMMGGSTYFPIETIQKDGQVTILFEMMEVVRRIHTDGRGHPADLDPTWMGDSIGHWEGDTLVVDTIGTHAGYLNGAAATVNIQKQDTDPRWPYSNKAHLTERIRTLDGGKFLEDDMILDDPTMYTHPVELKRYWRHAPELTPLEMICSENLRPNDDGSEVSINHPVAAH